MLKPEETVEKPNIIFPNRLTNCYRRLDSIAVQLFTDIAVQMFSVKCQNVQFKWLKFTLTRFPNQMDPEREKEKIKHLNLHLLSYFI